ncbi:MAG: transposase [Ruminococcus sp.]
MNDDNKELPQRKHIRLKEYDYSNNGCYFVTICVKEHKQMLGRIKVGRDAFIPPKIKLTYIGETADKYIKNINYAYDNITVDKYVIMPNHIHMIITIKNGMVNNGGMKASRPTLHTIVRSLKTMITKQIGFSVWQTSYYDHIIRTEKEYQEIWRYIDNNPAKWEQDELFQS